ncbi:O-antigen ligase family protein [Frankia sp. CiP3]|uniref:O-antigen ligase family protein n=1 Tax=Frankia sp. CiP3 TaxID=2880971 RepID=UPI001EF5E8E5|nr:O-antigen ligase family protein [Frankia sp. CiP3]
MTSDSAADIDPQNRLRGGRGALATAGASALNALLSALIITVVARQGGTAELGAYTVGTVIVSLAAAVFSWGTTLQYLTALPIAAARIRTFRTVGTLPALFLTCASVALIYSARGYTGSSVVAAGLTVALNNASELGYANLLRRLRYGPYVGMVVSSKMLVTVLVLAGSMRLTFALLVGAVFQLIMLEILGGPSRWISKQTFTPGIWSRCRQAAATGKPAAVYTALEFSAQRVDVMVLSFFASTSITGQYAAVFAVYLSIAGMLYSGLQVMIPLRSRISRKLANDASAVEKTVIIVGLVTAAFILLFAVPLNALVLGNHEASRGALWLRLLALGLPFFLLTRIISLRRVAQRSYWTAVKVVAVPAVAGTVLVLALVPPFLAGGAAVASSAQEIVGTVAVVVCRMHARRSNRTTTAIVANNDNRLAQKKPRVSRVMAAVRQNFMQSGGVLFACTAVGFSVISIAYYGSDRALIFAIYLLMLLASLFDTRVGVVATLAAYTLPVLSREIVSLPEESRLLAIPFIVVLAMRARSKPLVVPSRSTQNVSWFLAALSLIAALSAAWSQASYQSLQVAAGLAIMIVFIDAVSRLLRERELCSIFWYYAMILIMASTLLDAIGRAVPSGRVQGVFANPNGLALFCVLILPLCLERRLIGLIVGAAALWLTLGAASRGGTLALLVEVVFGIFAVRKPKVRFFAVMLLGCLVGFAGIHWKSLESDTGQARSLSVFREEDSRSYLWREGIQVFREHPLTGVGVGTDNVHFDGGSSYINAVASMGISGLVLVLLLIPVLFVPAVRKRRVTVLGALVFGGLVDAFFEAWLFRVGTVYAVYFWLAAAFCVGQTDRESRKDLISRRSSYAAAGAGLRRTLRQEFDADRSPLHPT